MRTGIVLLVLGLSHPAAVQSADPKASTSTVAIPLKLTIPPETSADSKPLPPGAILRIGSSIVVSGVEGTFSFSPDGKYLAVPLIDRTVEIWLADTGRVFRRIGPFSAGLAGAFISPDNQTIAVAVGHAIHLYDMTSRKEVGILKGHTHLVKTVAFSQDGKQVVTGSYDETLAVWDRQTGKQLQCFPGFETVLYHVALSADGSMVAGADHKGNIKGWTLPEGKPLAPIPKLRSTPRVLRFEDDGKSLMAVGMTDGLHRWDVKTGAEREALPQIKGEVSISPDGAMLGSFHDVGTVGTVDFWDRKSGKQRGTIGDTAMYWSKTALSDNTLASYQSGDRVRLWKIATGKEINPSHVPSKPITAAIFTRDGKTVISSSEDGTVRFWDGATGRERKRLTAKGECFHALALSPDGKRLALAGNNFIKRNEMPEQKWTEIHFWDVQSDQEINSHRIDRIAPSQLYFTTNGQRILAKDGTKVQIMDVKTGATKNPIPENQGQIRAAYFSADGRYLATVDPERGSTVMYCTDFVEGKEAFSMKGLPGDAVFSPDGKYLAVAGGTDALEFLQRFSLKILSVPSGDFVREINTPSSGPTNLTFSRDGRLLATVCGDRIIVFEVCSGNFRRSFAGHDKEIRTLAFSHDGRQLVSGGDDCQILVWDNTGRHGKDAVPKLDAKRADLLWQELASDDAVRANEALWSLVERPEECIPYLKSQIDFFSIDELKHLPQLIAQLDHDRFAIRSRAAAELRRLGAAAEPALKQALGHKSLEVREAARRLLEKINDDETSTSNVTRMVRTVEVLEQIGTAEAKSLLKQIKEEGKNILRREAAAALQRLENE